MCYHMHIKKTTVSYSYDLLGRLAGVTEPNDTNMGKENTTYTYDTASQLLLQVHPNRNSIVKILSIRCFFRAAINHGYRRKHNIGTIPRKRCKEDNL